MPEQSSVDELTATAKTPSMVSLVLDNVSKSYPTADGPLTILDATNQTFAGGSAAAITGPSGSGKSTLLHLLGGLDTPTSGQVTLNGIDPAMLSPKDLAEFRNHKVGFVFQSHYLLPQCTVLENVLLPALADTGVTQDLTDRAEELLNRVGLKDRLTHRPGQLSGGERQRAALARALVLQPTLLLADEPTGNLDSKSADNVAELLLELFHTEKTILIVVTHSQSLANLLPQRFNLQDGKLLEASASS